nr:hypothetical protein B0A51_05571 [Rachicladosporium sp. CCFEE 5018]
MYADFIAHAVQEVYNKAFEDDNSTANGRTCSSDGEAMAVLAGVLALINFMVVAINVSEAPSSMWSQHCWTLSRQMLWVHLSEFVVVSTLALCLGLLMLLA